MLYISHWQAEIKTSRGQEPFQILIPYIIWSIIYMYVPQCDEAEHFETKKKKEF